VEIPELGPEGPRGGCSARFGPRRAPGGDERGRRGLQKVLERDAGIGLGGDERAVDGGEGEAGELDRGGTAWVVAEGEGDPRPKEPKGLRAYPADDRRDLSVAAGGRQRRQDDEQAQEAGVALERLDGGRDDRGQVLTWASHPPVKPGQVGEEAVGAPLHDGISMVALSGVSKPGRPR
jgi:hypothetical protein